MAHTKAGGSTQNLRDSNPKFLGIKLFGGEKVQKGSIIVRQRGSRFMPGQGVRKGKDDTLYAIKDGTIQYHTRRKRNFDGNYAYRKVVSVV